MGRLNLKQYIGVLFAVGTILITVVLFETSFLHATIGTDIFLSLERKGYDILMRVRGERQHTSNVVLIRIDENTVKKMGYPLPHSQIGAVMAALSGLGAKSVSLDLILAESASQSERDSLENVMMAEMIGRSAGIFQSISPFFPSTVVSRKDVDSAAHFVIGRFGIPSPRENSFPRAPIIDGFPFPALANVSTGIGHITLIPDTLDGVIRSIPLFIEYAGRLYPSLGVALAFHDLKIQPSQIRFEQTDIGTKVLAGTLSIQTGTLGDVLINYMGSAKVIPSVSLYDIIDALKQRNEQYFAQFKNKVCIIGPTDRTLGDYYPLPTGETAPGFITHANVYDMIMMRSFLYPANGWLQFGLLLLVTLIIGVVAHLKQMRTGVGILLAVMVVYVLFAYLSFAEFNSWYHVVEPLFAMFFCFVSTVAYRAATEGKQRKMITNMFERYVDSAVVQNMIANPNTFKLGGEKREISLLFSDIKGFSTISEKLEDEVLVKLLNIYFTEMTNVIMKSQGTVDKFIGDAIMAFWGAPLPDSDAAFHACISALEMQKKLEKIQAKLQKVGNVYIKQRVGVNTGVCTVGNMGSESKFSYTAMGDAVNIASRLEGVNKQYGTAILISDMTYQKVAKRVLARAVDKVVVMGKTEPIEIFELMDLSDKPVPDKTKYFLEVYQEGLKAYQERRWDDGIGYFEHAMTYWPEDPVCQLYIERMRLYKIQPPSPDWNGVFILSAK